MAQAPRMISKLPVICVGNLTAGGAGKTPTTGMIVQRLIAFGHQPAILTRGYGGTQHGPHWVASSDSASAVGDEPLLHARLAPVMVARDRVAGARAIEADPRVDVIVMDDGLQNPSLAKSLTIAVIDGLRGLGNGHVIPAGPLRAPLDRQLAHVDAVLFNGPAMGSAHMRIDDDRREHMQRNHIGGLEAVLRSLRPDLPQLHGTLMPADTARQFGGQRVVAFAGIGHPKRFFDTVHYLNATTVAEVAFPDHHTYTAADAASLLDRANSAGARLVTTAKDHVRLSHGPHLVALAAAAFVIDVDMGLDAPSSEALDRLLRPILGGAMHPT